MAHIVPNPPNRDSANQSMTKFSILTTTGEADIFAWGLPDMAFDTEFTIAPVGTGTNGFSRLVVSMASRPGPYANMRRFHLKGLRSGDQIAIYRETSGGAPISNWVQHSAAVTVDKIIADRYAQALVAGTLPKYAGNPNIELYPFGARHRTPPMSEQAWLQSVVRTLDTINANPLGRAILGLLKSRIVIHPWIPPYANANSEVNFTPQTWDKGAERPGGRADEVLLHEFIHVLDNDYGNYVDAQNFEFDKTDFLSVNATNVYSCLLGRGLRKDHHGFDFLPNQYFTNPRKHFDDFKVDYDLAKAAAPQLYNVLKGGSKLWNPFAY